MKEVTVSLETLERTKQFVAITTNIPEDIDLIYGRYVVDAKSIMGICSMDLATPLIMCVHADEGREKEILEQLKEFITE